MSQVSKQALLVDNNQSFPDNNSGAITPSDLRSFNVDLIDSTVNQTVYTTDSGSWNTQIGQLNAFTASQQPSFNALNTFTASQLTINTGVNGFTQSANGRLNNLESTTSSLNAFSSSINQIIVNGVSIGTSTRFFFNGYVSASIVPNVDGAIASITILADLSFTPTASFNAYTASTNAFTASTNISITNINSTTASLNTSVSNLNSFSASTINSLSALNGFTASLDATYATDAQLEATASTLQTNINTKLNTSSFDTFSASVATSFSSFTASQLIINTGYNSYTASNDTKWNGIGLLTGSYATTGSNSFIGNQTISGSFTLTGSAYGNVFSASIASSTASIDLSRANFFTLTLPNGTTTNINITNPQPGTTAIIEITNTGIPTASFSSNVKQQRFNSYLPSSGSGTTDLLSVISLTTSSVYVANSLNFV